MLNTHHTKYKGDVGLAKTILDLVEKGFFVSIPITEHAPYDLIVDTGDSVYKVQAKYRKSKDVPSKTQWSDKNGSHTKYYKDEDFDFFSIFNPENNIVIYVPICLKGKSISFSVPNSSTPFYWYEDFLNFREDIPTKKIYKDFGIEITKKKYSEKFKTRKVNRPSKEELEKLLWQKPTSLIAKDLGVSDVAISKWCKYYNISKPSRGYWMKNKYDALSS